MKVIGVVPARMASSRFPGKPLLPICGRPMVEHVFERAAMFDRWDGLYLATCDAEIAEFGRAKGYPVIMTADTHTRALDRVAEAVERCGLEVAEDDVAVCVQGDEPMMRPDMIDAVIKPACVSVLIHRQARQVNARGQADTRVVATVPAVRMRSGAFGFRFGHSADSAAERIEDLETHAGVLGQRISEPYRTARRRTFSQQREVRWH